MTPKISVIVPVYKVEQYLPRCIDSILAQTFTDFELLLIDDGSPDNSGKICDEYAKKDERIRVFHKENGGVSSARNLGLDKARGEWIAFVDSDDILFPDSLSIYNKEATSNVCDLYIYGFTICFSQDKSLQKESGVEYISDSIEVIKSLLRYKRQPTLWNKLYKASLIGKLRFDSSLKVGEDMIFNIKYISQCNCIKTCNDIVYCYRINQSSTMQQKGLACQYDKMIAAMHSIFDEKSGGVYKEELATFEIISIFHPYYNESINIPKTKIKRIRELISQSSQVSSLIKIFSKLSAISPRVANYYLDYRRFKGRLKNILKKDS